MVKNVFLMSVIRNKFRNFLIFTLVFVASFVFVLRGIEYLAVQTQVNSIADTYISSGFFYSSEPFRDVSYAIPILEDSPNVSSIDTRVDLRGFLVDLQNSDYVGAAGTRGFQRTYYDSFFYGRLIRKTETSLYTQLLFSVDYVAAGMPEHVLENTNVLIEIRNRNLINSISYMQQGNRYFIRTYSPLLISFGGFILPPLTGNTTRNPLSLLPLNLENTYEEPIFFIYSPDPNISAISTYNLYEIVENIQINHRTIILSAITDMNTVPAFQGASPLTLITQGRNLTRYDYLEGNHVAVVHYRMGASRGLSLGDTITIKVPVEQYFSNIFNASLGFSPEVSLGHYSEVETSSNYHSESVYIDVEIVGFYRFRMIGLFGRERLNVYIPMSILPYNLEIKGGIFGDLDYTYVPNTWLNFVLADSRYEQRFILDYRDTFYEMGLTTVIVSADASLFWETVIPLLTNVRFNFIIFAVLFVFISIIAVFLYTKNNIKQIAITRALGNKKKNVYLNFLISISFLSLPAIGVGSYIAYLTSRESVYNMMYTVAHIRNIQEIGTINTIWVFLFGLICFAFILLVTFLSLALILKVQIHELLQGNITLLKFNRKKQDAKSNFKGRINWVSYQLKRQPVKNMLIFCISILFVVSTVFLQESIQRTRDHIDFLYDETILDVEINRGYTVAGFVQPDVSPTAPGFFINGVFHNMFVENIRNASFVRDVYTEAGNIRSFLLPNIASYSYEELHEQIGLNISNGLIANIPVFNFLYGSSDLNTFIQRNTHDLDTNLISIEITFAPNFSYEHFVYGASHNLNKTPVIVYEGALIERNLEVGDSTILGFATTGLGNIMHKEVIIIGSHNGAIHGENLSNSTLIPLNYLENMLGIFISYTTLNFSINPLYNRNLEYVRYRLETYTRRGGFVPLELFLQDEQLLNQIILLEQTLYILESLYPIAITFIILVMSLITLLLIIGSMKNAAVMRVIGNSKGRVLVNIASEAMSVFIGGIVTGLVFLVTLGWGFDLYSVLLVGVYYILTSFAVAVLGAMFITSKPPLYMLQVRE